MAELSEGRIVELKSGGPQMTVHAVADGVAVCRWFTKDDKLQERSFPLTTVRPVDIEHLTDEQLEDIVRAEPPQDETVTNEQQRGLRERWLAGTDSEEGK